MSGMTYVNEAGIHPRANAPTRIGRTRCHRFWQMRGPPVEVFRENRKCKGVVQDATLDKFAGRMLAWFLGEDLTLDVGQHSLIDECMA